MFLLKVLDINPDFRLFPRELWVPLLEKYFVKRIVGSGCGDGGDWEKGVLEDLCFLVFYLNFKLN